MAVTASTDTTAQIVCVVILTYVVALGGLAHSIAGTEDALSALFAGPSASVTTSSGSWRPCSGTPWAEL